MDTPQEDIEKETWPPAFNANANVEAHESLAILSARMRRLNELAAPDSTGVTHEGELQALVYSLKANIQVLARAFHQQSNMVNLLNDKKAEMEYALNRQAGELQAVQMRYSALIQTAKQSNLQKTIALRDAIHWKANHDNRVKAARMLIERLDVPIERIDAYRHYIVALKSSAIPALVQKGELLRHDLVANLIQPV